jgi:hypothetical protein
MERPSRKKSHPARSLFSSQPGGPPCWACLLAFGLIGLSLNTGLLSISPKHSEICHIYVLFGSFYDVFPIWPSKSTQFRVYIIRVRRALLWCLSGYAEFYPPDYQGTKDLNPLTVKAFWKVLIRQTLTHPSTQSLSPLNFLSKYARVSLLPLSDPLPRVSHRTLNESKTSPTCSNILRSFSSFFLAFWIIYILFHLSPLRFHFVN